MGEKYTLLLWASPSSWSGSDAPVLTTTSPPSPSSLLLMMSSSPTPLPPPRRCHHQRRVVEEEEEGGGYGRRLLREGDSPNPAEDPPDGEAEVPPRAWHSAAVWPTRPVGRRGAYISSYARHVPTKHSVLAIPLQTRGRGRER